MWRIPANGGAEEQLPKFSHAGFARRWTITETGIYFLAENPKNEYQLKFYDFADELIKSPAGDYKIPSNITDHEGLIMKFDKDVLLCTMLENPSRLMLAELL